MKPLRSICVLIVLAVSGGCASSVGGAAITTPPAPPTKAWPMYQYFATHNAVFHRPGFRVTWERRLGGRINGGLAVLDNTLYAVSFDHRLYAINESTGQVRWSASTSNVLMSTPVISNGIVIVGTGRNGFLRPDDWTSQVWGRPQGDDIIAFSTNAGRKIWSFHTHGEDMPSPAIVQHRVVFANGDLHAYGLNFKSGEQLWQTDLLGVDAMAAVTTTDGLAFISSCRITPHSCETRAIDIRDGHTVWQNSNGGSDCSPAVANGIVFVDGNREGPEQFHPGGEDVVAALDERTGRTLWRHESDAAPYTLVASGEHHIAGTVDRGILYQSINNANEVIAFDGKTGRIVWEVQTWAPVKMSPVVTADRVYFGDIAGLLYDVDRLRGTIIRTTAFEQSFSPSAPVIVGQTLFVANGDHVVALPLDTI